MAEGWQDYFPPGDTLLWEGAPKRRAHGVFNTIGLSLFGMAFLIGGVAFIVVAIVVGQWYAAATAYRRLRHAVSSRCADIAKTNRTHSIESYPILKSSAPGMENGRLAETLSFHVQTERDSDGDRTTTRIRFDNIAEGETVYRLLRSIQMGTA